MSTFEDFMISKAVKDDSELERLRDENRKLRGVVAAIANLWPQPPHCADVMAVYGENDGTQRAILLAAALELSRLALDLATCPQCGSKSQEEIGHLCKDEAYRSRWHSLKLEPAAV